MPENECTAETFALLESSVAFGEPARNNRSLYVTKLSMEPTIGLEMRVKWGMKVDKPLFMNVI